MRSDARQWRRWGTVCVVALLPGAAYTRAEGQREHRAAAPAVRAAVPRSVTGSSPAASRSLLSRGAFSHGPRARWWDDGDYAKSVGLTQEQQRRMDGVFQENRPALVSGLDNLHRAEKRLEEVSNAEHPSEDAVLGEIQSVAQARADLAKANARLALQLRNEMTVDQLRRMDELK